MNIWAKIALKVGEKIIVSQAQKNIWSNPNTTYQQKQFSSNLINAVSTAKDIFDVYQMAEKANNQNRNYK